MIIYRLSTLIIKELQMIFRNTATLRLLMMPVILQSILFPFAATLDLKDSTLAIFDQAQSAFSIELSQRLSATAAFPEVLYFYNEADLEHAIDTQRALIGLRIPLSFKDVLSNDGSASIQAIIDGRRANSAQIAFGYVSQIVQQLAYERGINAAPVFLNTHHFYNPNLDFKWFILPSLVAIITTIGTLIVTALSLAREREEGTYDQLLVSPLTPLYIMIGKAVPAVIVAMIQGTMITVIALVVYRVPFTGSIGLHYFSMLCYALSLIGFGLFISALSSTQQQAFLGVFFFMIPAVVLSGFMAPVENMPPFLYGLTQFNPLTHYISLVRGIFLKNYTFHEAWPHIWPLLMIFITMFFCAYRLFQRKVG